MADSVWIFGENCMTLQKWPTIRLGPVNHLSMAINVGFLLNFAFKLKLVDVLTCVFFPSCFFSQSRMTNLFFYTPELKKTTFKTKNPTKTGEKKYLKKTNNLILEGVLLI